MFPPGGGRAAPRLASPRSVPAPRVTPNTSRLEKRRKGKKKDGKREETPAKKCFTAADPRSRARARSIDEKNSDARGPDFLRARFKPENGQTNLCTSILLSLVPTCFIGEFGTIRNSRQVIMTAVNTWAVKHEYLEDAPRNREKNVLLRRRLNRPRTHSRCVERPLGVEDIRSL